MVSLMTIKPPRTVAILPARLESSRLPRKPLADICGLPMIIHVMKRTLMAKKLHDVYVATDSSEISKAVQSWGGKVILTGSQHQTGTDRIAEAAQQIDCDIVVNVQGDEALIDPDHIDSAINLLWEDPKLNVGILVTPFTDRGEKSVIKAVLNERNEVMYFSREDIPSNARTDNPPMFKACHVVPFRKPFLLAYAGWARGNLETIEYNEYLRILEKGYVMRSAHVNHASISVDTLQDLEFVRGRMLLDPYFQSYRNN